jgi:hypothetical protein
VKTFFQHRVIFALCLLFFSSGYSTKVDIGVDLGLGYAGQITQDSRNNDLEDYSGLNVALSVSAIGYYSDNLALRLAIVMLNSSYDGPADKIEGYKEEATFHFNKIIFPALIRFYPTPRFYLEAGFQICIYEEPLPYVYYYNYNDDPLMSKEIELKFVNSGVLDAAIGLGTRFKNGIEVSVTSAIDITPSAQARTFRSDYSDAPVRLYTINFNISFYFLQKKFGG